MENQNPICKCIEETETYMANEIQTIQNLIYEIRGQRVMLDRDLAEWASALPEIGYTAIRKQRERAQNSLVINDVWYEEKLITF